jgi:hypothetical protein
MDRFLGAVRNTGLDSGSKLALRGIVGSYVRSYAQVQLGVAQHRIERGEPAADAERAYGAALARLVDPTMYPYAAELFRSDRFDDRRRPPSNDTYPDFTYGLAVILDGIATAVG